MDGHRGGSAGVAPTRSSSTNDLGSDRRRRRTARKIIASVAGIASIAAVGMANLSTASAATVTGTLVAQSLSAPGGGAFLPGGGGHFWVSDAALGLCETLPATASTTKCNGSAKGGQVIFDAAKSLVYVADTSSKTNQFMRYPYNAATDTLGGATIIQAPSVVAVGGGTQGARAMGLAMATGPDGAQRLYVSYIKSGDIMQVLNPSGKNPIGTVVTPTVTKVGHTSDSKGVNSLSVFTWTDPAGTKHDDLYIAETGGNGMSVIRDVDGTGGRPACGVGTAACGATTVINASGGALFSFPAGLTNDGHSIYLGDSPANTPARVLTWNPVTGAQSVLSTDISPAYTSGFDGVHRTQYQNIIGMALNPATLDVYVGDDPSFPLLSPLTAQGHAWKIAGNATQPVITGINPATGDVAGGTVVTITGTNLVNTVAGSADPVAFGTTVSFGTLPSTKVSCLPDGTSCTATSSASTGVGLVDVRVTNAQSQTSAAVTADQFGYTAKAAAAGAPAVTGITPTTGISLGGTSVSISGTALVNADGSASVSFGTAPATSTTCAADGTKCTAVSPPGTDGTTVDVQVTTTAGTSPVVTADKFTYATPIGALVSYGITAPKGGLTWMPDSISPAFGHYWISDHGNGLCRLDPMPGTTISAPNTAFCDPGYTIGSPGQAVYDPRPNADGTHWVYVPDNAVKSPGVWRLTFHPATATIDTPVAMAPGLLDNLKTNSLALDPVKDVLYVGDLIDGNIRRVNAIFGDPRLQTVDIIAVTQPQKTTGTAVGRGINGTMALLGNRLYLPENNAATYVDTTAACANPLVNPNPAPCATTTVNFLATPAAVFVAGIATDAVHNLVYISESPGTANATIFRFDASTITAANPGGTAGVVYVTAGKVPATGSPEATNYCTTTCTRPADPALIPGGTTGFPFAQGLYVDPTNSSLFITEDASAGNRSGRGHAWVVPFTP
jgi:IPT/TIG domain